MSVKKLLVSQNRVNQPLAAIPLRKTPHTHDKNIDILNFLQDQAWVVGGKWKVDVLARFTLICIIKYRVALFSKRRKCFRCKGKKSFFGYSAGRSR